MSHADSIGRRNRGANRFTLVELKKSFQSELGSQGSSSIEKWLIQAPVELKESVFVELLEIEVGYRVKRGERVAQSDYQLRFPEYAAVVESFFKARQIRQEDSSKCASVDSTKDANADNPRVESTGTGLSPLDCAGRYRLDVLLGRGSFGEVWKGWDPDLKRVVAVKIPRTRDGSAIFKAPDFLEEARRAASLIKHDGIVPVYDVGSLRDGNFIVSEYVEGPTLADLINRETLSRNDAVRIVQQIAIALHHAHLSGIIHRDIKPANVLMRNGVTPVITDFGLAVSEEDQLSLESGIVGTLSYMSPEQARGETRTLDGRTDIYSLGVILFQLLTRRLPFHYRTHSELLEQIKTREVRPLRSIDDTIPEELDNICLKCLAKRVTDRYATGADLAKALDGWLKANDGSLSLTGGPRRLLRYQLGAIVIIAIAAITSIVITFVPSKPQPSNSLAVAVPQQKVVRDEWISLLNEPPEKVVWITSDATDFIKYNADDKSLLARAENTFFVLASNQQGAPRLRLKSRISMTNWVGSAGFVWAMTPIEGDIPSGNADVIKQRFFACLIERFHKDEPLTVNIREVHTAKLIPNILNIGEQFGIAIKSIAIPQNESVLFECDINQQTAEILIDGKNVWTADFSNTDQAGRVGVAPGRVGFMIRGESVGISDASVMFVSPK